MDNFGYSQGLTTLMRAFEAQRELDAKLVITGTGVAAGDARAEICTDRVEMPGMVDDGRLEHELRTADIALVSQHHEGSEFNIPSKLMNFMAYGLPLLGAVNPTGEVARIVRDSAAGWIVDSSDADAFPRELARLAQAQNELADKATRARQYAEQHFTQASLRTGSSGCFRLSRAAAAEADRRVQPAGQSARPPPPDRRSTCTWSRGRCAMESAAPTRAARG